MIVSAKAGWDYVETRSEFGHHRRARQPGPEPQAHEARLCRHLLFAPPRSGDAIPGPIGALDTAVRQGKALYVGISSYSNEQAARKRRDCARPRRRYSSTSRAIPCSTAGQADYLLDRLEAEGMGCIVFSPLAQGMLTDRYLEGVSRRAAVRGRPFPQGLERSGQDRTRAPCRRSSRRRQTLAQMALAWVLRDPRMTSALIGASRHRSR